MFGPGDPSWVGVIAQRMAQHRAWFGVDDGLPRQWAHVDDVARGLRLAAERGQRNAAYFLAGEQATIPHWFGHAHRASGLPSPTIWIPYAALNALVHLIRRLFPRWVARVPFLPAPTPNALTTRAERELGWRAQPLGEALRDLGQWGNV
jgi:nucleoside-diphosphate-sugar epimerase